MAEQITLHNVTLPVDLEWVDEYRWSTQEQTVERTLSGGYIVDVGSKDAGRPITLVGRVDGNDGFALITRTTVDALKALESPPGAEYELTLADDSVRTVILREDGPTSPSIEATPQKHIAPHVSGDLYAITIRLMEV